MANITMYITICKYVIFALIPLVTSVCGQILVCFAQKGATICVSIQIAIPTLKFTLYLNQNNLPERNTQVPLLCYHTNEMNKGILGWLFKTQEIIGYFCPYKKYFLCYPHSLHHPFRAMFRLVGVLHTMLFVVCV